MDSAERCRMQAEECRRLLALAQSEAVAEVLKHLSPQLVKIANQTDRYVEIVRKEPHQSVQNAKACPIISSARTFQSA